jgi:hypothetical protein
VALLFYNDGRAAGAMDGICVVLTGILEQIGRDKPGRGESKMMIISTKRQAEAVISNLKQGFNIR